MNVKQHLALVATAETDCALHAAGVRAAWRGLKDEMHRSATPLRIVVAGAVLGFVSGRPRASDDAGLPGRLLTTIAQMLLSTLGAGAATSVSAGAAAGAAAAHANAAAAHAAQADTEATHAFVPPG